MQLPGALIPGMFLLRVQFQRSILNKAESWKLAWIYLFASFVLGLFQSFIIGYLFTMALNYYTLYLVFGLPTSSNATTLIDIVVIFVLLRLSKLCFSKNPEENDEAPFPDVTGDMNNPLVSFP